MSDDQRLQELACFTPEGKLTPGYGQSYIFLAGRDDIHGILKYLISSETLNLTGNAYGYDDEEVNDAILALFKKPHVSVQMTLDKSQAGGVHERKLVELDRQLDPIDFNNSFAIGNSETHQISHTKAFVLLGQGIYIEGSTNLSASGEGTGINLKDETHEPRGWKAQNNTLVVSTNPVGLMRLKAKLDAEHRIAQAQMLKLKK